MNAAQLEKIVVNALEDIKGRDIEVINTAKLTPLFERIVVASGDSNRQVRSLARNVEDKIREAGGEIISTEGEAGVEARYRDARKPALVLAASLRPHDLR